MKKVIWVFVFSVVFACQEAKKEIEAQTIIDKAIDVSGGEKYNSNKINFRFRDILYSSNKGTEGKILSRSFFKDSTEILDILNGQKFSRYIDSVEVKVHDTMAVKYANSINSVHYFARLPYGLNDKAVMKRYLGESVIDDTSYFKIEVTFKEEGGGDDFDDIYVYWFNKNTYRPDFLAYEFHVDGGGMRFRKAVNERYVKGIRFVDYLNYKPKSLDFRVYELDSLYTINELELLSQIELRDIEVTPDSYN